MKHEVNWIPPLDSCQVVLLMVPPAEPRMPSLRLASVIQYLRQQGCLAQPLDLNGHLYRESSAAQRELWSTQNDTRHIANGFTSGSLGQMLDAVLEALAQSSIKVLGLLVNRYGTGLAVHLARRLKQRLPHLIVIAHGEDINHPECRDELSQQEATDYFVVGEEEISLNDLLTPLLQGQEVEAMPGVLPASHLPHQFSFQPREPADLDALPLPTFSDISLDDYVLPSSGRHLQLQTSRGCISHCAFCQDVPLQGSAFRMFSPEAISFHLALLKEQHGLQQVEFSDLILNGEPQRLMEWCEDIAQQGLGIIWTGQCTFVEGMTEEVMRAMRLAGCISLCFGLESGSNRILTAMGKPYDTALASSVLHAGCQAGLHVAVNLMAGFPGETEQEFQQTLDFLHGHHQCINELHTVSTCEIRSGCRLSSTPDAFGVSINAKSPVDDWHDTAGNTSASRNGRLQALVETANKLGIPTTNVVDDSFRGGEENSFVTHCRDQLRSARLSAHTISTPGLELTADDLGRNISLHVGPVPLTTLTTSPGLSVVLGLDQQHPDNIQRFQSVEMSCGRWCAWKTEDGVLHLESALLFADARLHIQASTPSDAGLVLLVDFIAESTLSLKSVKVGLYLESAFQRYFTLTASDSLELPPDGLVELLLCRAPANFIMVAGAEQDENTPALSIHATDGFYWDVYQARNPRGQGIIFSRQATSEDQPRRVEPGSHRLFSAQLNTVPHQDVRPISEQGGTDEEHGPGTDFVLVHCPPGQNFTAPLWPAILASSLRAEGYSGTCQDLNTLAYRHASSSDQQIWERKNRIYWRTGESFEHFWTCVADEMQAALDRILALRPRMVCFTTTNYNIRTCIRLAEIIKEAAHQTSIVFTGPGVHWTVQLEQGHAPEGAFDPWTRAHLDPHGVVDIFLRGEADRSLPQVLHRLQHNLDPLEVPGAMALRRGRWRCPWPAIQETELDQLPYPDFSDLALPSFPSGYAPLLTSRGCIFSCAFCSDCAMQGTFRRRTADNVMGEIVQLRERYDVQGLELADLVLNGDLAELESLCNLLITKDVNIPWKGRAAIRREMTAELLRKMTRAGCRELLFSLDSLSQPVLDSMRKEFSVEEAFQVIRQAHEEGIEVAVNLLVGFPRETPQLYEETLEKLAELSPSISRVQAINACHIATNSRLANTPELFGLDTGQARAIHAWQGPFANTPQERQRRVLAMKEALAQLGLPLEEESLDEEDADRQALLLSL